MRSILSLILVLGTLLSVSAFAQRSNRGDNRIEGNITLGDGRTVVRINVGDDRDDRELLKRVRRLEQAVRDLQDQVYDLQSQPQTRTIYVCSGTFFSVGTIIGKASTLVEAKAIAMNKCQGSIFCKEDELKCERTEEFMR